MSRVQSVRGTLVVKKEEGKVGGEKKSHKLAGALTTGWRRHIEKIALC